MYSDLNPSFVKRNDRPCLVTILSSVRQIAQRKLKCNKNTNNKKFKKVKIKNFTPLGNSWFSTVNRIL